MVGGLHPSLKKEWYLDLLRGLRALDANLHIKAFTAIEVRHLAQRIFKMSIRDTLELLRASGLGSITGGGAEIFDAEVRDKICRGKETAEEWLDVHRTWHQMGGRSTCTMRPADSADSFPSLSNRKQPCSRISSALQPSNNFAISLSAAFIWTTSTTSPRIGLVSVCRSRRFLSATASTICMAPLWRKRSFTWPAPPPRSSKASPRSSTRSAKPAAFPFNATVIIATSTARKKDRHRPTARPQQSSPAPDLWLGQTFWSRHHFGSVA